MTFQDLIIEHARRNVNKRLLDVIRDSIRDGATLLDVRGMCEGFQKEICNINEVPTDCEQYAALLVNALVAVWFEYANLAKRQYNYNIRRAARETDAPLFTALDWFEAIREDFRLHKKAGLLK